jgi:two-component system, LytTR family, response regulator
MTTLRALIVDDEPMARRGISARLRRMGVEVVGECRNGTEALAAIQSLHPDVVYLDVQMPELDGFGVLAQLPRGAGPAVVFVTAFDQHALKAFEAHAVDYLLKPIDDERFVEATERVRQRVDAQRAHEDMPRILATLAELQRASVGPPAFPARIAVTDRGRTVLIETDTIGWIEADDDYVWLHVAGKSYLVRETMTAMKERLPGHQFVRIHRSTIVNASRVRELRARPNRDYIVVLDDGTSLKLSRSYREHIAHLVGGAR